MSDAFKEFEEKISKLSEAELYEYYTVANVSNTVINLVGVSLSVLFILAIGSVLSMIATSVLLWIVGNIGGNLILVKGQIRDRLSKFKKS